MRRRPYRFTQRPAYVPPSKAGNLYYVRLCTPVGMLYKIGFTTMGSVHERLAFRGDGTDTLIDRVLLFAHFSDASDLEQELHKLFRRSAAFCGWDEQMPLFANGQSELYCEDVLELDNNYSRRQSLETAEEIEFVRHVAYGADEALLRAHLTERRRQRSDRERRWAETCATPSVKSGWMVRVIGPIVRVGLVACIALVKLVGKLSETGNDRRIAELRGWLKDAARAARMRQLVQLDLRDDARSSIQALKRRDLAPFEQLVDIERLATNVTNAMTEDLALPSDYMGVANNCGLLDLVELMHREGGCRDLLLRPVEEHYARTLRDFVTTHRLGTEELLLPDDLVYHYVPPELIASDRLTLSDYFGPKSFLSEFGRTWTLPEPEAMAIVGERCAFSIAVANEHTGFSGHLTVSVGRTPQGRLDVTFPNFLDLSYQACEHEQVRTGEPDRGLAHRVFQARQWRERRRLLDSSA
jgi:hypothetical protein